MTERPHHHPRLLITAGPTHEPIDAVRYLGNRSSGRLGIELADRAAAGGWPVTLLLGPTHLTPSQPGVETIRYRTTSDLGALLLEHQSRCAVLVMAAAVADYRPIIEYDQIEGKLRRTGDGMVIRLESTEDLLATCSTRRAPGQLLVGFALEPRERMLASARGKLERKGIDLIVANPLETMEGTTIEAVVLDRDGSERRTEGAMDKRDFAGWLLGIIEAARASRGCG